MCYYYIRWLCCCQCGTDDNFEHWASLFFMRSLALILYSVVIFRNAHATIDGKQYYTLQTFWCLLKKPSLNLTQKGDITFITLVRNKFALWPRRHYLTRLFVLLTSFEIYSRAKAANCSLQDMQEYRTPVENFLPIFFPQGQVRDFLDLDAIPTRQVQRHVSRSTAVSCSMKSPGKERSFSDCPDQFLQSYIYLVIDSN